MINLKRTLMPIRVAIPSLLVLSAAGASWHESITTQGNGFGAASDTSSEHAAAIAAWYSGEEKPVIHLYAGFYPAGGGDFVVTKDELSFDTTDEGLVMNNIDHDSVNTALTSVSDFNDLGYVSISWY